MAIGISVSLPLKYDSKDGPYKLNKDFVTTVRQNMKSLFLTSKGEKIMDPDFGVGLRRFLFENASESLYQSIETEARRQVQKYMPFVTLVNFSFSSPDLSEVQFSVRYSIVPLDKVDGFTLTINAN